MTADFLERIDCRSTNNNIIIITQITILARSQTGVTETITVTGTHVNRIINIIINGDYCCCRTRSRANLHDGLTAKITKREHCEQ